MAFGVFRTSGKGIGFGCGWGETSGTRIQETLERNADCGLKTVSRSNGLSLYTADSLCKVYICIFHARMKHFVTVHI